MLLLDDSFILANRTTGSEPGTAIQVDFVRNLLDENVLQNQCMDEVTTFHRGISIDNERVNA